MGRFRKAHHRSHNDIPHRSTKMVNRRRKNAAGHFLGGFFLRGFYKSLYLCSGTKSRSTISSKKLRIISIPRPQPQTNMPILNSLYALGTKSRSTTSSRTHQDPNRQNHTTDIVFCSCLGTKYYIIEQITDYTHPHLSHQTPQKRSRQESSSWERILFLAGIHSKPLPHKQSSTLRYLFWKITDRPSYTPRFAMRGDHRIRY